MLRPHQYYTFLQCAKVKEINIPFRPVSPRAVLKPSNESPWLWYKSNTLKSCGTLMTGMGCVWRVIYFLSNPLMVGPDYSSLSGCGTLTCHLAWSHWRHLTLDRLSNTFTSKFETELGATTRRLYIELCSPYNNLLQDNFANFEKKFA